MNNAVGSRPEGGYIVHDVMDESFFNFIVKLMGSTNDESTLLWRSNNPMKKNEKP